VCGRGKDPGSSGGVLPEPKTQIARRAGKGTKKKYRQKARQEFLLLAKEAEKQEWPKRRHSVVPLGAKRRTLPNIVEELESTRIRRECQGTNLA